jgi:hypothetical protein
VLNLIANGYALKDARDDSVVGCSELTRVGKNNDYASDIDRHFQSALATALNERRQKRFNK